MRNSKVQSFTLAELLVVMVLTTIVVGIAFSVLTAVQQQLKKVNDVLDKTTQLAFFEQQLYMDFTNHTTAYFNSTTQTLTLTSDVNTINYHYHPDFVLRNTDTLNVKVSVQKNYFEGVVVLNGSIDAISITADPDIPNYPIFIYKNNDATSYINTDGL